MKILLTGCKGQLGTDFSLACEGRHELVSHDVDLDITDRAAVVDRVLEVRPDLVMNAAAYTDVDGAETDELGAFRVNALGVHNIALACAQIGAPLVHMSTDYVFSGDSTVPYTEFDRPDPRGAYAKSKYAGECYVRSLLDRYFIVRTSWLFGVGGGNFVKTMMRLGRESGEVKVVTDQEGCPTYSRDLAKKILEIVESGAFGVYHVSNGGRTNWNGFAREIFEVAGIEARVLPTTTEEIGRPAPRPRFAVLRGLSLEMQGFERMRPYREALEDFILRDLPAWEAGEVVAK